MTGLLLATTAGWSATPSRMPHPMPFSINFWAGPGDEPMTLKVASNYEAATHHRRAPAAFGAIAGEP